MWSPDSAVDRLSRFRRCARYRSHAMEAPHGYASHRMIVWKSSTPLSPCFPITRPPKRDQEARPGGLRPEIAQCRRQWLSDRERVVGFYNLANRLTLWGSRGAFWGGLWVFFSGVAPSPDRWWCSALSRGWRSPRWRALLSWTGSVRWGPGSTVLESLRTASLSKRRRSRPTRFW